MMHRMRRSPISRHVLSACCSAVLLAMVAAEGAAREVRCVPLALEVWRVEDPPAPYAEFCAREPAACALAGDTVVDWEANRSLLERVNRAVNDEITLVPDAPGPSGEECWELPMEGRGDCEDLALEKRRRLVAEGLPSAATTMAIVHHEVQFFPHAVLLVETTRGTWVLDSLRDEVVCWDAVPYRYDRRERPDGRWERYFIR